MTHAAALNTIDAIDALLGVHAQDRLLAVSALDFDLSVYDLFGGAVPVPSLCCRPRTTRAMPRAGSS